ncbi:hypothetical protein ANO11243_008220 [Dothideomycetidae sp. 11243]|nr:hypothetical protein ANO11243_008220 [fungal sp. No.11243]
MAFKSLIVPAVALAGYAAAQSNSCSTTATVTLQSQGDAAALAGCTTFSGSIAIETGVSTGISLDGIEEITGDLVAKNATFVPSLEASSLQSIGGTFSLAEMTLLTSLTFPQLTSVANILWVTLPRLSSLGFTSGVTQATSVSITDTQLGSLQGLILQSVKQMILSNNNQLNEVDLPIKNIDTAFSVEFNGRNMTINLPNLVTAYNMTFRNVSELNMPSLAGVNASLGFYGCDFSDFALPNITSVGGDISFIGNDEVTNITMPQLSHLTGALQMSANAALLDINGFPDLSQVGGAIDINGNFTNVTLPALKNVQGACNLQSTADISSTCTTFNNLHSSGTIQGKVTCAGKESNPGGLGSSPSSSSTSTQKGEAGRDMYARSSAVTGVLGVFAALLGML